MGQGNLDQPIISADAGRSGIRERIWGLVGGILGRLFGGGAALIAVYIEGASTTRDGKRFNPESRRNGWEDSVSRLDPLKALFSSWLAFYLLTHGVSLPADGRIELGELAISLYYGSLSWLRIPVAWVTAVVEFLGRICSTTRWS